MAAVATTRPTPAVRVKAALWFAERGFGIFSVWSTTPDGICRCPDGETCTQPGKHPITLHGFKDATRDAESIRTMLSAGSTPNYGMVPPEGVFAWDVDEEDDGVHKLERLEALYGPLPPTMRTNTAHGQHVFLRWPEGVPRPLKKMFGYVTRWGSGRQAGYVIGPRSVHATGAVYQPPEGVSLDIAEIPERWVRAVLDGEASRPIVVGGETPAVGGRHDWLRDKARWFRGLGLSREALGAALRAENDRLDQPKSSEEVERAIGRVFEQFPADPVEETEERVSRRLGEDELSLLGRPKAGGFPTDPDPIVFGGLLGSCVHDIAPGTDASLVGLLGCLLAFAGALVPGAAYFHRTQTSSPFIALVGESSVGRKGTAMMRAHDAMTSAIEPVYVNRVVLDGLNSGEGLVTTLHYKREAFPHEPTVGLVFEEEYAGLLASRQREGSTLDPKMRQAFDGGPISNRRSGETKTVVPPYWLPALIAITPDELRNRLEGGALRSGSANRWLYLAVVKRDVTPTNELPVLSSENRRDLVAARRATLDKPVLLTVDPAVTTTLAEYADFLSETSSGVSAELVRRLGVIAFRVALIHALVERSAVVSSLYLHRAIALTEYGRHGIPWIFGETIGSPDADLLLRNLVQAERLTKREITQQIIREPVRRQAAIDELIRYGRAEVVTSYPEGGGRPRSMLVATAKTGEFREFRAISAMFNTTEQENSGANGAENGDDASSALLHETPNLSTEGLAQNSHETRTLAQNSVVCLDYPRHQDSHRWVVDRWVCLACEPAAATG